MSPELERLFLETAELEPEARGRYLDEHCSNPEMRARVERLLLFDSASEEFLKSPLQRFAGKVSTEAAKRIVSSPGAAPAPETAEPALSFQPGAMIGDYEVVALLGAGGMGRVYKVRNLISDRWEAAKVLVPDLQGQAENADRFAREIKLHASLAHPNIAKLHTAFRFKKCLVMVMELLEGMTLQERLRQSPIPAEEGVYYICQVLEALSYAHARGVVHRDIKPANIMLTSGRTAKLMDFGVARAPSRLRLTNPGTAVGSVAYMAPEQLRGQEPPDPRSDLYATGVTLYELATGVRPFEGITDRTIMLAQLHQLPGHPRGLKPDLPARLPEIILQSLAKNPGHRFQTAGDFRSALLGVAYDGPNSPDRTVKAACSPAPAPANPRCFVGRKEELANLIAAYESAASDAGRFVCLSGEPGMGKTALVQALVAELGARPPRFAVALGRCAERLSEAEPYRSMFEAIESLLNGPEGGRLRPLIIETAPNWAAQMPQGEKAGPASKQSMIREGTAFLQRAARLVPIILCLEDLQWSDIPTLDLLLDLASRLDNSRILIVGTYRPHHGPGEKRTFHHVRSQLRRRAFFREITLDFLTLDDCWEYVNCQFPGSCFAAELSALAHSKTGGNPFFLVELIQFLRNQRFILRQEGQWRLTRSISGLAHVMPESVRAMIDAKLQQLSDEERSLLQAASVQGVDFDSALLSKALSLETAEVEDRLDATRLERGIIRCEGESELPDGSPTVRYRFMQDADHDAVYTSLNPARRASLTNALAEAAAAVHSWQPEPRRSAVRKGRKL